MGKLKNKKKFYIKRHIIILIMNFIEDSLEEDIFK